MAEHFPDATKKADCISREAAIQFFKDWVDDLDKQINDSVNHPHLRSDYKVCKTQLLDCIHAIKEMPAADVRLVVRGKWEFRSTDAIASKAWTCSVCGRRKVFKTNFCPNCGADMRLDKNGQRGEKKNG